MFKNYNLAFLFILFLIIFVLVPKLVLAIDTGCTNPLEYCRIKVGEKLEIDQNTPGFICGESEERRIVNKGTVDIFVPMKDCNEYAEWRIHIAGLQEKGFYVCDWACCGIADGQRDEGCDGICQACMNEECGIAAAGTDPWDDCTQGTTASDGCHSDYCSGTDASCAILTSGDGGCSVCGTCSGATSIACLPHFGGTYDSGCSTCQGCNGSEIGSCTSAQTTCCGNGTYGCTGTNRCYNGNCIVGLPTGTVCTAACDCASTYCYVDADNDRYAPASGTLTCKANSQLAGTDCYDENVNAYPGQTSYFTVHRGDGSFDYDCDGQISKSNCSGNSSCTRSNPYSCNGHSDCSGEPFTIYRSCSCTDYTASCGQSWWHYWCDSAGYTYCYTLEGGVCKKYLKIYYSSPSQQQKTCSCK